MKTKKENSEPHFSKPLKIKSDIDKLFESPPFEFTEETSALFVNAMRSAMKYQLARSRFLRNFYKNRQYSPDSLKAEKDIVKIPFISVQALKERDLATLPESKVALELKSSGTSGQRSRMLLDRQSLLRVRRMAWQVFKGLGLADLEREYYYICFTYDPKYASDVGTAWTDKLLTDLTRKREIFYAFKWNGIKKDFYFDINSSVRMLEKCERENAPVRLIGFPAFVLKLTEEFRKRYSRTVKLNPVSAVITGGGWKNLQNEAVDKDLYRRMLADNLGLPIENIRDLFGMVEHGVPYVDCERGNFHIPNYGRVIARDPATLQSLGLGKKGLLQFITPYLTSYPSISLLSGDFGAVLPKCSCGRGGHVLKIYGRAGVKKLKGCAVSASTML